MKIGIPRAGLYYKFFPLWDTFFKEIGVEPIYSPPTNEVLLKKGIALAHSDICFPMKVFFGHTWWLKDKADLLFVPRVISLESPKYLCPKFIGLPDMLKASISELPPVIDVNFNARNTSFIKIWQTVGKRLGIPFSKVEGALARAVDAQANYKWSGHHHWNNPHPPLPNPQPSTKIGIVARPYIIYDGYMSAELIKRLEDRNISVCTIEDLSLKVIRNATSILKKPIYFDMGEQNVGAAFYFLDSNKVDGFIHLISFDCGPDSILKELIDEHATRPDTERVGKASKVPYTTLILDEHTGVAGSMTRVEAFLDMVQYRKKI